MSNTDIATLDIIRAAGGAVRHSWMSGWLNVKGLRIEKVKALADAGLLTVTAETFLRRTKRSSGMHITITTYTLAA